MSVYCCGCHYVFDDSISVHHYYWGHSCVRHLAECFSGLLSLPPIVIWGEAGPAFYLSNPKGMWDLLRVTQQTNSKAGIKPPD